MKFGQELKLKMVQAWRDKYIRYDLLKKKIKEIKNLYEEYNVFIESEINNNSISPKQSNNKNQKILPDPIQLKDVSAMNLKNYLTSSKNETMSKEEFLSNDDYEIKMDIFYVEMENKDHSDNDIKEDNQKYLLRGVTKIIQPNLSQQIPSFPNNLQEIHSVEKEFVALLERDMVTVSAFYAKECEYFANQYNALIKKVSQFVKHQNEYSQKDLQINAQLTKSIYNSDEENKNHDSDDSGLEIDILIEPNDIDNNGNIQT
eukprot:542005_1